MTTQQSESILWDVALAALLTERYKATGQPLNLHAITRLADQHNIRMDDLMDTLCKLTSHGAWQFMNDAGETVEPDTEMCQRLLENKRLNDIQLDRLHGRWQPVDASVQ